MSTAPSVPGSDNVAGLNSPLRPAPGIKQPFVALSELAHPKLTMRDLLPLLPAVLISFIFNFGFVVALILFNENPSSAAASKKIALGQDDVTAEQKKDKDEDDPIDLKADDLTPDSENSDDKMIIPGADPEPDANPGIVNPPDPSAQKGVGEGPQEGIVGNEGGGIEGLPGQLLEDAKQGFKGDTGSGVMGDGSGLFGGGGGSMKAGGFGLRNGDLNKIAKSQGGNDASQQAVALGLQWLAIHQNAGGYWSLDRYHQGIAGCRCKDVVLEADVQKNDTAGTGMGLLPFLAAGHTHTAAKSRHKNVVFNALKFLISKQDAKGDLGGGMYSHGIATIGLCEAYGMTQDQKLRIAAQNAIRFIVSAQNTREGSWRYVPKSADGDISVVGWQVMALRSGQMAGLDVDAKTLDGAKKYLDACSTDAMTKYAYQPGGGPTHTMTAAALLSRQYLGWGPRNPGLVGGCDFLLQQLPPKSAAPNQKLGPVYYYYYASQVMHHMGDKYWETWNPLMRDFLVRTQEKEDHKRGSWDPDGADWGKVGGRIYSTSLAILTLEVYYRHLPLYRREGAGREAPAGEMKKEEPKKDEAK